MRPTKTHSPKRKRPASQRPIRRLTSKAGDAAQKLALLTLLGFGVARFGGPNPDRRHYAGASVRHRCGRRTRLRRQTSSRRRSERHRWADPCVCTQRSFPAGSIMAGVRGAYNAIQVDSRAMGRSLYHGRGAGPMPTGMAVVSDIIELCAVACSRSTAGGRLPRRSRAIEDVEPQPARR